MLCRPSSNPASLVGRLASSTWMSLTDLTAFNPAVGTVCPSEAYVCLFSRRMFVREVMTVDVPIAVAQSRRSGFLKRDVAVEWVRAAFAATRGTHGLLASVELTAVETLEVHSHGATGIVQMRWIAADRLTDRFTLLDGNFEIDAIAEHRTQLALLATVSVERLDRQLEWATAIATGGIIVRSFLAEVANAISRPSTEDIGAIAPGAGARN
jgi:hypothetical protein